MGEGATQGLFFGYWTAEVEVMLPSSRIVTDRAQLSTEDNLKDGLKDSLIDCPKCHLKDSFENRPVYCPTNYLNDFDQVEAVPGEFALPRIKELRTSRRKSVHRISGIGGSR